MKFDQMTFATRKEFTAYMEEQWEKEPLFSLYETIHNRFEENLKNAINKREKVRSGKSDFEEEIEITLYDYIKTFLRITKREEIVEGVKLGKKEGYAIFDLFEKTVRFVPKDSY